MFGGRAVAHEKKTFGEHKAYTQTLLEYTIMIMLMIMSTGPKKKSHENELIIVLNCKA